MMNEQKLEDIRRICKEFAAFNSEIVGLALGGSWALGAATKKSDVNLILSLLIRIRSGKKTG